MNIEAIIKRQQQFGTARADADTIHIVFGSDANYARPMGILMTSILQHNGNVAFHVFADCIHEADQQRIGDTMEKFHASCTLYEVDTAIFQSFPTTMTWTMATYFRFLAGEYFYQKLERIIYLDGDMLCIGSLRELYTMELGGKYIAAVRDGGLPPERLQRLHHTGDGYFNAGMLLIDIRRWHQEKIFDRAIGLLQEHPERYEALDQDVLNMLYQNHIYWLDIRYNQANNVADAYPADTVILHYTSTPKPWLAWYYCSGANLYEQCRRQSCWRDVPLISQPRTPREHRLLSRALFQRGQWLAGLAWYIKYLRRKL